MVHEEEEMYHKEDEINIESQDHGKEEKANMSSSRAVIEHQIWFYLPGSCHYDNMTCPHVTLTELCLSSQEKLYNT